MAMQGKFIQTFGISAAVLDQCWKYQNLNVLINVVTIETFDDQ
jgi:hypothetical protein